MYVTSRTVNDAGQDQSVSCGPCCLRWVILRLASQENVTVQTALRKAGLSSNWSAGSSSPKKLSGPFILLRKVCHQTCRFSPLRIPDKRDRQAQEGGHSRGLRLSFGRS